jgi:endonuclease-3
MKKLEEEFPNVSTPLHHSNLYELTFAVMMSAQTTDEMVNRVTQRLFSKYNSLEKFVNANISEIEKIIKPVNYYKTKAKRIKRSAEILLEEFDGEVPDTMKDLIKLPGVGRKTANVILSEGHGKNIGFVVDTHVKRTAYRTRLTNHKKPENVEKDLMKLFPKEKWNEMSLRMIFHGRTTCPARRKPNESCSLGELCDRL